MEQIIISNPQQADVSIAEYRKQLVEVALSLVGVKSIKYRNPEIGITPEGGFDCSGLVVYCLETIGFPLPILVDNGIPRKLRHCNNLLDFLGVSIHEGLQDIGDIAFFCNERGSRPKHIGIMISNDHYAHAPGKDDTVVTITEIKKETIPIQQNSCQLYTENLIGFKRLALRSYSPAYGRNIAQPC